MTQSKKRKFMLLAVILGALLLVALGTVLFNRVSAEYRSLNDADRQLLREFSQYCEQTQRADIWNGFNLSHRTVLAIGGLFQPSYLINPLCRGAQPVCRQTEDAGRYSPGGLPPELTDASGDEMETFHRKL